MIEATITDGLRSDGTAMVSVRVTGQPAYDIDFPYFDPVVGYNKAQLSARAHVNALHIAHVMLTPGRVLVCRNRTKGWRAEVVTEPVFVLSDGDTLPEGERARRVGETEQGYRARINQGLSRKVGHIDFPNCIQE